MSVPYGSLKTRVSVVRKCPSPLVQGTHTLAETTPEVYQASGYADIAADKSIWYAHLSYACVMLSHCMLHVGSGSSPLDMIRTINRWSLGLTAVYGCYYTDESRAKMNQPGATSMVGLLSELGPCRTLNDSSGVELNPTSWTEFANVCVNA